jgi:serine/threonine protein kinase
MLAPAKTEQRGPLATEDTKVLGETAPPAEVPLQIGGFPVVRLLGEGGMGRVYACKDEKLDRLVAVKVLRPDLTRMPAIVQRFLREAKAMARVHSTHVVTVHSVGEEHGVPFLVMEMLEGEDLAALVHRKGQLPVPEALRYLRDAVTGLADAALAGIIHRDVKPANLFLVDGRVTLTDFGLALPVDADARLTQEGLVVGTPHYIAPELARGGEADEVSDIYSLGATFYELLTGSPPYPGEAALDVISAHLKEPVPDLHKVRRDASPEVKALLEKLMAKKVAERFSSYSELAAHLDELLAPYGPLPRRATDPRLASPPASRSRPSGATPSIKTANLTVMFAELAGYSERTGQHSREDAARWLALYDALLTPLVRAFRGKAVKTLGDALLFTFASPTDAVLCGTAIQDRLAEHNATAPADDHIHGRVALSAGEVRVHKGDVLGEPVTIAARLEKLAAPGQVLLSEAVYATLHAVEVPVESIGERTFKGIRRAVLVYRALPTGGPGELPYGGKALQRAGEASSLNQVADKAARAVGELSAGLRRALGQSGDVDEPARAGRRLSPGVLAAAGGLLLVLVLLVAFGPGLLSSRMSGKEARATLARIDALAARSAEDDAMRARALEALGQPDEALLGYSRALRRGRLDEQGFALALRAIDASSEANKPAVDLLAQWPDPDVERQLRGRLAAAWWPRHNALLVLEKRNAATNEERTLVGARDLLRGETCGQRRYGLLLLKRGGAGPKALAAVKAAGERMPENICMVLDLEGVQKIIEKRGP